MTPLFQIPKEDDYEEPSNNRTISLLPVLFLIICRLPFNQSGDKEWLSTENSLVSFMNASLRAIDQTVSM